MKLKMLSLMAMFLFGATAVFAGNKTESFKVFGNCGMCKSRIEKAAKSVEGVSTATWDKVTKMMEVTFDDAKTDVTKIKEAIIHVGHDTEKLKASDEVYNNLPGCCLYDRVDVNPDPKQE
ncbi:MAG: cation transporter [Bacteroidales bacterium]|nr:cation transporter [Bacteroidales bacterium]